MDVRPPTNIVQPGGRDSSTVWLDLEEKDPARRFKMFRVIGAGSDPVTEGKLRAGRGRQDVAGYSLEGG